MPVWHRVDLRGRGGAGLAWKFAKGKQEDFPIGETTHMFTGRQEGILKWNRDIPVPPQIGYVVTLSEEYGGTVRLRLTEDGEVEPATAADAAVATITLKVDSGESNWLETGGLDLEAGGASGTSAAPDVMPTASWKGARRSEDVEGRTEAEASAAREPGFRSAKKGVGAVRPVRLRGSKKSGPSDEEPA